MHAEQLIDALSKELCATGGRMERIGIDIVHVQRIRESMQQFGNRFAERMFTAAEAAYARSAPHEEALRLAARFAAKEAAIKALSLSEAGVDWRDIEVVRAGDGHCTLALHGRALEAASTLGVTRALVCLSHDGDYAIAVVAALSDNDGIRR